jgi:DNA-binding beta-propeller fold protein YncE
MRKFTLMVLAGMAAMSSTARAAPVEEPQVITVPGFADFLAVDGKTVWATNKGRVEQWSRAGKLAEVAIEHPCGAMAVSHGSLWVANCGTGTLERIDIKTAKLVATIATGIANPKGELNVVAGAGSIWVASDAKGVVSRIDPATNAVIASVAVDPGTWYMAFGQGAVWAVSAEKQTLQRIDPKTNAVTGKAPLGKEPGFLAAGLGGIWVQEQGDGTLARIDPRTVTVTGRVKVGDNLKWGDIDTGAGKVWLRTTDDQVFVGIDRKLAITTRLGKAAGSGALRYVRTGLWTTAHDEHTLTWWPKSTLKPKP